MKCSYCNKNTLEGTDQICDKCYDTHNEICKKLYADMLPIHNSEYPNAMEVINDLVKEDK